MTLDLSGGKAYYGIDPDADPIQTTHGSARMARYVGPTLGVDPPALGEISAAFVPWAP